jgi:hypothetical protein
MLRSWRCPNLIRTRKSCPHEELQYHSSRGTDRGNFPQAEIAILVDMEHG